MLAAVNEMISSSRLAQWAFFFRTSMRVFFCFLVICPERCAQAAKNPLIYAVIVGNNDGLGMLPHLRYADDDAIRFYRLATQLTPKHNVALLTDLDVDTWQRLRLSGTHPPPYLTPTKDKLLEVIQLFKRQIAKARKKNPGLPVHLYFFFSGHGERGYFFLKGKKGALADAAFTGTDLRKTFADSSATLNALFIDACKSQSLFIDKGRNAEDEELGPNFDSLISTLDQASSQSPIGIITSTVSNRPAGEARDIRGGYFSHVLISGLSGAADANSDGKIQYGELVAFVAFHTRRIAGQRPWFRPPNGKLDTVLLNLKSQPHLLKLQPGFGGHFAIFDAKGNNLVLEIHKTQEQFSRLILAPTQYKIVWIKGSERGLLADLDLRGSSQATLTEDNFTQPIELSMDRVPKGEGLGAPTEETEALAIHAFDPNSSGFDQPFTPRVVATMSVAYSSGLTTHSHLRKTLATPHAGTAPRRHRLAFAYGYVSPPVTPITGGQGVSLAYSYRFHFPLYLGGRALFGFSSHIHPKTSLEFQLQRLALQAEALYGLPLWRWFSLCIGGYFGWQSVFITQRVLVREGESEHYGTNLLGDAKSFRLGFLGSLDAQLPYGLWLSVLGGWGADFVHQNNAAEEAEIVTFWRPSVLGQIGYAF